MMWFGKTIQQFLTNQKAKNTGRNGVLYGVCWNNVCKLDTVIAMLVLGVDVHDGTV